MLKNATLPIEFLQSLYDEKISSIEDIKAKMILSPSTTFENIEDIDKILEENKVILTNIIESNILKTLSAKSPDLALKRLDEQKNKNKTIILVENGNHALVWENFELNHLNLSNEDKKKIEKQQNSKKKRQNQSWSNDLRQVIDLKNNNDDKDNNNEELIKHLSKQHNIILIDDALTVFLWKLLNAESYYAQFDIAINLPTYISANTTRSGRKSSALAKLSALYLSTDKVYSPALLRLNKTDHRTSTNNLLNEVNKKYDLNLTHYKQENRWVRNNGQYEQDIILGGHNSEGIDSFKGLELVSKHGKKSFIPIIAFDEAIEAKDKNKIFSEIDNKAFWNKIQTFYGTVERSIQNLDNEYNHLSKTHSTKMLFMANTISQNCFFEQELLNSLRKSYMTKDDVVEIMEQEGIFIHFDSEYENGNGFLWILYGFKYYPKMNMKISEKLSKGALSAKETDHNRYLSEYLGIWPNSTRQFFTQETINQLPINYEKHLPQVYSIDYGQNDATAMTPLYVINNKLHADTPIVSTLRPTDKQELTYINNLSKEFAKIILQDLLNKNVSYFEQNIRQNKPHLNKIYIQVDERQSGLMEYINQWINYFINNNQAIKKEKERLKIVFNYSKLNSIKQLFSRKIDDVNSRYSLMKNIIDNQQLALPQDNINQSATNLRFILSRIFRKENDLNKIVEHADIKQDVSDSFFYGAMTLIWLKRLRIEDYQSKNY